MINEAVINNIANYKKQLSDYGWVTIPNFLDLSFANHALDTIEKRREWDIATLRQGQPFVVGVSELAQQPSQVRSQFLNEILMAANTNNFHYLYEFVRIVGPDSKLESDLNNLVNFFSSEDYLSFGTMLLDVKVEDADAQVTKYTAGYFLKQHCDVRESKDKNRIAACVLGLTKGWNPDWGGLLNIMDEQGEIVKTISPKFNTMSIFSVPQQHFVSQVSNFCSQARYSVTGWMWSEKI
ncbi:MAG: 2OG-Fe(II) oxygenase [Kangiellaceae bacterium]|nr:2OG-Fe(II) oxygenase [Kangiellaceae bacterium]